jgi:hypothetical protein
MFRAKSSPSGNCSTPCRCRNKTTRSGPGPAEPDFVTSNRPRPIGVRRDGPFLSGRGRWPEPVPPCPGHARFYAFGHEMSGGRWSLMILAESEPETRSLRECRVEAVCEIPPITPEFLAIVRKEAARSRPGLRLRCRLRRVTPRRTKAKKQGVHNVYTQGSGLGCTGAGRRRIGEVCGGVADFQGEEPVRVPPRAQLSRDMVSTRLAISVTPRGFPFALIVLGGSTAAWTLPQRPLTDA